MKKILKVSAKRLEIPLSNLIEYDKNNKIHWDKQIDAIANSINRFSYYDEIVIDKNNVIIAWHWRLSAIKKMWYDWVEVKQLDIDSNEAGAMRILDNLLNKFDTEDNLENIVFDLDNWMDLQLWDIWTFDFLPELNAPKYNPDDYLNDLSEEQNKENLSELNEEQENQNFSEEEFKLNEKIEDGEVKISFILPNPNHFNEIQDMLKNNFNVQDCIKII